ncbi:MAG: glycosyltransferase [Flavobacteriaceae bacterium]|nr:glycosyltransferase [Flavobacteriaceae bacterium]
MEVGIIIPCYNEAKRLDIQRFRKYVKAYLNFHLCFVNDGSQDDTLLVLNTFQNEFPDRITVIDMKKNQGKAAAIRAGARFYYAHKKVNYVGYLDADLSTDFEDFNDLLKQLKKDRNLIMVFGSRNMGSQDVKRNFLRKAFSIVIMSIIHFILKRPTKDTQYGAKVFRRRYIPVMYNSRLKSRWLFDTEIFLRLKLYFKNKNIMNYMFEYPLKRWSHAANSEFSMKDSLRIPFRLAQIWLAYI